MAALERIAPHNLEAEMAVLGAILLDRSTAADIIPQLDAAHFYAHVHGTIFNAIVALHDAGEPLDKITLAGELRNRGVLEKVGGASYLSALMETVQTVHSAGQYAKLVREKAVLRQLQAAAQIIANAAQNGEDDVTGAIAIAEASLAKAVQGFGAVESGGHVADLMRQFYRDLSDAEDRKVRPLGTPWRGLNFLMGGGWFPGESVVWFGRPKDGKSAALGQLALQATDHGGVIMFALELGDQAQLRRWLGSESGVETRKLRSASLVPSEHDRLHRVVNTMSDLPLWVYGGQRSISEIRRLTQAVQAKQKVSAIIIDHVGFLADVASGGSNDTEHTLLQNAYRRIHFLAQELGVVVHIIAHANRDGYDREPRMKDIRGGGNPEGIVHTVVAIYRPDAENNPTAGKFIILANREGATGAIPMYYDGTRFQWRDLLQERGVA